MNSPAQKLPVPHQKPPARRMLLAGIIRGRQVEPYRICMVGLDGIGKSTFAAGAPSPVFLEPEAGSGHLDVARFPKPESWQDILDAVEELRVGEHQFKTLVVDTLDHAEALLWADVCRNAKVDSIEAVGGGYGKGYLLALDGWRTFLAALERLQRERGMHIVLLAHSFVKKFANPEGDDYDRYVLKLHDKSASLIREWCKAVLFAAPETFAVREKGKTKARGVSTGARLVFSQRTAAYDAKDRYGLPERFPLDWPTFEAAANQGSDGKEARARIDAALPALLPASRAAAQAALGRAGDDAVKLAQLANWCEANIPETQSNPQQN